MKLPRRRLIFVTICMAACMALSVLGVVLDLYMINLDLQGGTPIFLNLIGAILSTGVAYGSFQWLKETRQQFHHPPDRGA